MRPTRTCKRHGIIANYRSDNGRRAYCYVCFRVAYGRDVRRTPRRTLIDLYDELKTLHDQHTTPVSGCGWCFPGTI